MKLITSGYKETYALHHPPLLYLIVQRATSHRYTDLAQRHHTHQLRLRCFSSWLHLVRTSQGRRKVEVEAAHHQEKMAALLQAAALGRLTTGTSVSDQRYIYSPEIWSCPATFETAHGTGLRVSKYILHTFHDTIPIPGDCQSPYLQLLKM